MSSVASPPAKPIPGSKSLAIALLLLISFIVAGLWLMGRGSSGGPSFERWIYPGATQFTNMASGRFSTGCFVAKDDFDTVSKYYEQELGMKNSGDPSFMGRTTGFFGMFGGMMHLAKVSAGTKAPHQNRIYLRRSKKQLIFIQLSSAGLADGTAIRLTSVFLEKSLAPISANEFRKQLEYPDGTTHSGGSAGVLTGFHYVTTNDIETVWNHYRQTRGLDQPRDANTPAVQVQVPSGSVVTVLPTMAGKGTAERTFLYVTTNAVATVSCYGNEADGQTHLIITATAP